MGVEIEIQVPCVEGEQHPVRLLVCGWGQFEVVYNPCTEALSVFGLMSPCSHYLKRVESEFSSHEFRALRIEIVQRLAEIGDKRAVPALIQALGDGYLPVRQASANALGKIGDPQAVPALIQALGDRYWLVRRASAKALAKIN